MKIKSVSALIIEDDPYIAQMIRRMLNKVRDISFELVHADRLSSGLEHLQDEHFAIILLDLGLPDSSGIKTLNKVYAQTSDIPIIVFTGQNDETLGIKAVNAGAEDYLIKGQTDSKALVRAIRYAVGRHQAKKALKKTTAHLKRTVEKLKKANQKIINQQKSVIEEERLKMLLLLSGATANELNQPLTELMDNVELMRFEKKIPPELKKYMCGIEDAGQQIFEIIKRIQTIPQDNLASDDNDHSTQSHDKKISIMSVEKSDADFKKISNCLKTFIQLDLTRVKNIKAAITQLNNCSVDLILSEHFLPDGTGLDILQSLSDSKLEIPVVIISQLEDETIASEIINAGAYDYLPKNKISKKSLSRSITNTVEKFGLEREIKLAQEKLAEMSSLEREMKQAQIQLAQMSTRDELTGLYNRRYFIESLKRELARAKRYKRNLGFCMIDLDKFKNINDRYGHLAGDMALSAIGRMIDEHFRQGDLICRYGGEEFAVILPDTSLKNAMTVCERLRKKILNHKFKYDSSDFSISISIGIALYNNLVHRSSVELVSSADQALYRAKKEGRNSVRYHPDHN
ncbi:MAG: diguanylate cyclase [Thermodesulfobacteriota bacterium]|nr:diguanylate cyclase [Thermodesulfobacteriota bacterium]